MLRPFLLVGVGGSGGKTLRKVYQSLDLRLKQEGWKQGWPGAWQLLHVDSPINQDGAAFPAPFLPAEWYFNLVAPGTSYKISFGAALKNVPQKFLSDNDRALPSDQEVEVDVTIGAGKFRAIGRTLVLARLDELKSRIRKSLGDMTSDSALSQLELLAKELGAKQDAGQAANTPIVIVISSIAGGSGAGQFIEVTEAIKNCAPTEAWVHNIYSILYAPDVFASVGNMDLVAPNALAAMSESMSGMWTKKLSDSTNELYKAKSINIPLDPRLHVGPKFNYVVGRQNSTIDFADQPEVYKAVAASLSTWMTSEIVQDELQAYAVANFVAAVGAMNLPDNTRLDEARTAPPFASLGFGRVSLGKELFLQYASERLARASVDRMLFNHLTDHQASEGRWEERVQTAAKQTFNDFLRSLELNTNPENNGGVLKALRPESERVQVMAKVRDEIHAEASAGVSSKTGGMPVREWSEAIYGSYSSKVHSSSSHIQEEKDYRVKREKAWVQDQKLRTLKVVARAISQQGIKIAQELLKLLEEELQRQASGYQALAISCRTASTNAQFDINQALQAVESSTPVRPENPVIVSALDQAADGFWYQVEGDLYEVAAILLRDFSDNFVAQLRNSLSANEQALVKRITTQGDNEHTQNLFQTWPKADQETVPPKFDPAPNEFLLIPTTQFPTEYKRLLSESVANDRRSNALAVVVDEALMGSLALEDLDPRSSWSLISLSRDWIPERSDSRKDSSQTNASARFEFSSNPLDYLNRAQMWMERQGSPFYEYLHEDIASYLSENMKDVSTLVDRQTLFRQAFSEALRASEPLVKINPSLLFQVHGKQLGDQDIVFSDIPFDRGSQNYDITRSIMANSKLWDDSKSDGWFNSAVKVQNIDIFSVQLPYQPIVMDSIMSPIWESWLRNKGQLDTRENFCQWRKARPLFEAIPASSEKKEAMLRGWFVARVLNQLKESFDDVVMGPHLEIYSPENFRFESFPYPLLHPGIAEPEDYPGVIMHSLSIALALCNSEANMEPLRPYHRLIDLGDTSSNSEFVRWISRGEIRVDGQPEPRDARAGRGKKEGTVEERKTAVRKTLNEFLDLFAETIEAIDHRFDTSKLNYTWELRREIRAALEELITVVGSVREGGSGI